MPSRGPQPSTPTIARRAHHGMEFTGTPSWARLPAEIRLMILNQLVHAAEQDGSSLASYAAVCSEWQDAIEPVTFWSLNFTAALLDAPGFSEMATRAWRLGLVRRVCVFISLPEYGCPECERPPRLRNMGRRSGTMTTARHVLNKSFCILNGWDRQGDLSLDITIQSASDADHYFKDMDIGPPRRTTTTPLSVTQDPRHGWVAGRRVSLPPEGAILRLFEPIEVVDTALLPQVTAVTRLVLRRQTTRRWDLIDLDGILRRCVKLKEFHFEPWRGWTSFEAELEDDDTRYFLKRLHRAAKKVTKLVLFEDFSDAYATASAPVLPAIFGGPPSTGGERHASPRVSRALARGGGKLQRLEHLSAAFLVDAADFLPELRASPPDGRWGRLASLTLTSRRLAPDQSSSSSAAAAAAEANDLFADAARAAARLPALQRLKLWNGGRGLACVFRYRAPVVFDASAPACASLLWRATWAVELRRTVVEMWRRVACRVRPCELRVVFEELDPGPVRSHGDAISLLGFEHDVVTPLSLEQIRRENRD